MAKMRILVLLSLDAANYVLENVMREFIKRGHEIIFFSRSLEPHNIRMFSKFAKDVRRLTDLTEQDIKKADIIFAANDTVFDVINYEKTIFTINMASVLGTNLSEGGDVMFMPSYQYYREGGENTTKIVVGNTKKRFLNSDTQNTDREFLFIDSGHFPFGYKGKLQVAQMLLDICYAFSDYRLTVKPRFLKSDKEVTHLNKIYLYDVIEKLCGGKLPKNMNYLQTHEDMYKLITKADVVILPYGSSVYDACADRKKCLIVSGFQNEDSVDLNNNCTWDIEHEILKESGCVVRFEEVCKYLPNGLEFRKEFSEKHTPVFGKRMAYEYVVDITEMLFEKFISKGIFFKKTETDVSKYESDFIIDDHETWDTIIARRYENQLRYVLSRNLDVTSIRFSGDKYADWCVCSSKKAKTCAKNTDIRFEAIRYRNKLLIENHAEVIGNPVGESYWLDAVYQSNKPLFERIKRDAVSCKRSYDFYRGMYSIENGYYFEAYNYLNSYVQETKDITHEEYVTDLEPYRNMAVKTLERLFPFRKVKRGEKIIIYGYGFWGKEYLKQINTSDYCRVVAIADRDSDSMLSGEIDIIAPNQISAYPHTNIFISIKDENARNDVKNVLRSLKEEWIDET